MVRVAVRFIGDWTGILAGDPAGDRDVGAPAPDRPWREIVRAVSVRTSVKDLIESLGVPHTEIGAARIRPVATGGCREVDPDLGLRIEEDCAVEVDPVPRSAGATVDPSPRFALDVHLGGLAVRLRLLGFDSLYRTHWDDADLARTAIVENRWLLTRDRGLLKRSSVRRGCLIRGNRPGEQAREILDRLGMRPQARPWTRCLRCNGPLETVAKAEILDRLQPMTRLHYEDFWRCSGCARIYWEGSHTTALRRMLDEMRE